MIEGRLEAIWVKRMKQGPMDPQERISLVAGRGIKGSANQGGKRQITIISVESWAETMRDLNAKVDPAMRRANLLVSGVNLKDSSHRTLAIGECEIYICGETQPCKQMEEVYPGLYDAMKLSWRGGAHGEVISDGTIEVGNYVRWIS